MRHSTVSVAIATFNRRAMVREAIEAALRQTLEPCEVCVADDASTDGTGEMLLNLAALDSRVRVLRQGQNTGGVENWNAAIRETSGEFIAWCSDDDRFLEDHLKASVGFLDDHPYVGLVHSSFVDAIETEEARLMEPRPLRFNKPGLVDRDSLLTYMVRYYDWPFHPSTIVMRRSVWEQVGPFNPSYALADTDWFLRAAEKFMVAMLPRHGVLNRRHPGNWSNRLGSARMQQEIREIVERSIERLYPHDPITRWCWTLIWRATVRTRLLLTMAARLRTGHADAASAAWQQAVDGLIPVAIRGVGESFICSLCRRRTTEVQSARERVSPL